MGRNTTAPKLNRKAALAIAVFCAVLIAGCGPRYIDKSTGASVEKLNNDLEACVWNVAREIPLDHELRKVYIKQDECMMQKGYLIERRVPLN